MDDLMLVPGERPVDVYEVDAGPCGPQLLGAGVGWQHRHDSNRVNEMRINRPDTVSSRVIHLIRCRTSREQTMRTAAIGICIAALAAAQDTKVTPLMTKALAGIPGKEAVMVTVEYAPGASSTEHRHNAHTFVYVLEGSVVMQVKGGKEMTLGPGQTFYESPDDIHSISRNASATKPAKILVFFVKQKGAPITVPAK